MSFLLPMLPDISTLFLPFKRLLAQAFLGPALAKGVRRFSFDLYNWMRLDVEKATMGSFVWGSRSAVDTVDTVDTFPERISMKTRFKNNYLPF